jgi:hypothetical protein
MADTQVTAAGNYLARCRECGAWVEVSPEDSPAQAQPFFVVLLASFYCCGLRQTATFVLEKDTVDFH